MKIIIAVVITAIGLFGTIGKSVAESNASQNPALSVQIYADDDELGNLINSYVSRELRSLKDVTVNESHFPTFAIHCSCVPVEMNGVKLGYAISFVITSNLAALKYIDGDPEITGALDPKVRLFSLKAMCLVMQAFEAQSLSLCSANQLKEKCESFVAAFDTKYLNPVRAKQQ
jgi:hypothetical protein